MVKTWTNIDKRFPWIAELLDRKSILFAQSMTDADRRDTVLYLVGRGRKTIQAIWEASGIEAQTCSEILLRLFAERRIERLGVLSFRLTKAEQRCFYERCARMEALHAA